MLNKEKTLTEWHCSFNSIDELYIKNINNTIVASLFELKTKPNHYQLTTFIYDNESLFYKEKNIVSWNIYSQKFLIKGYEESIKFAEQLLFKLGYVKLKNKLLIFI